MKIVGDTIIFKSDGYNYLKERDNHKCNTIRQFRTSSELSAFEGFLAEYDFNKPNKKIKIIESSGKEGFFIRTITDITLFQGYYIFSWKPEGKR